MRSSIGYLTVYGISVLVLASLPPQRHTPFSSLKRLNCLVRVLRSENLPCALFTQRSSALWDSSTGSTGGLIPSLFFKVLSLWTALTIFAVTPISLESVLNLVRSKIESRSVLGSMDTRLCNWVAFSSKAHSLGMDYTSLGRLGSKPTRNHSGPRLHSWDTNNSSEDKLLEGRSAGFEEPGQWLQRSGWTLWRISLTLLLTKGLHFLVVPQIQNRATRESV